MVNFVNSTRQLGPTIVKMKFESFPHLISFYMFCSVCKSEYDAIIQLNCHTNTTTSGFAHILNLTFSIFITFFVLYTEKTLFGYCNFMDNDKPITETVSVKERLTDRSIVTLKYAKIQCLLKRRRILI
ncbi:hypothetical protein D917_07118 [Trichinella nativa]|uniref:Uncharacterized protein n=1 Tax=Trichinella nativa TaxID=6335 RepID=A0A1Y3EPU5_9BILA|nr:hypothetical protein D917_07118 [Trichinella nativa]